MFIKLSKAYVGGFTTGAAGAFANNTLKLNSCADPLGSLGSGAPVGFSAYCGASPSLYGAYIVHAVKIHCEVTGGSGIDTFGWGFAVRPGSMAAPTSLAQAACLPRAKTQVAVPGAHNYMSAYYTVGQVYGQSPQTVAIADSFSALYNADPSSTIIGDIFCADTFATTQLSFSLKLIVTQWVEVFGRNTIS